MRPEEKGNRAQVTRREIEGQLYQKPMGDQSTENYAISNNGPRVVLVYTGSRPTGELIEERYFFHDGSGIHLIIDGQIKLVSNSRLNKETLNSLLENPDSIGDLENASACFCHGVSPEPTQVSLRDKGAEFVKGGYALRQLYETIDKTGRIIREYFVEGISRIVLEGIEYTRSGKEKKPKPKCVKLERAVAIAVDPLTGEREEHDTEGNSTFIPIEGLENMYGSREELGMVLQPHQR